MTPRSCVVCLLGAIVAAAAACTDSSPTAPSAAGGGSAVGSRAPTIVSDVAAEDGSTLKASAPTPQSPGGGMEVETLRPVLTVANAQASYVDGITLSVEFELHQAGPSIGSMSLVDGGVVAEGPGTTSFTPGVLLTNETDYQWRARALLADAVGPWSEAVAFRTNVPVTIDAPLPLDPALGEVVTSLRPVLQVANPEVTGDAGRVLVQFEIAADESFGSPLMSMVQEMGHHPEAPGQASGDDIADHALPDVSTIHLREQRTSVYTSARLETDTVYFWRSRATNGSSFADRSGDAVVSEYSDVLWFQTPTAAGLASIPAAPSQGGTGGGGGGTAADQIDFSGVVWLHPSPASWPQTSTITNASIGDPPICINHTQAGRWPAVDFGGTLLEGNVWVFVNIGGTWYAGTYEWLRPGQICKEITSGNIGEHVEVPPLSGWRPRSGEQIGLMVSTPARSGPAGPRQERSNVVLATWP